MIYKKIEQLCKDRGISIARLEKECGLGNATIRNWKLLADTPRYSTLKIVANYFGISVDELVGNQDE